ncbi:MAG: hypothetical protein EP338_07095 [Bacteroidetes bacterium]|nr:MAG: hypothetical protein EP338_07095 [Bacteroidota bacterium]
MSRWKLILASGLLLMGCTLTHTDSQGPGKRSKKEKFMNLVFYNVENLFDTKDDPNTNDAQFLPDGELAWDESRYQKKLTHLAEALSLLGEELPVIIGLAEVENKEVLNDLIKTGKLKGEHYAICHQDSPDKRGIDCALLYDSDRFKLKEFETIDVSDRKEGYYTRDILYVSGWLNGSDLIHCFVNHWSSRRDGQQETEYKRVRAAKKLRASIDQIQKEDPNANIVAMGDFNDKPDNKSVREVLRARSIEENLSPGDLVNLLTDEHESGKGTISYRREWMVFDQMIVSQNMLDPKNGLQVVGQDQILYDQALIYTYKSGDTKPNETYGGRNYYGGYSDHLPVYIKLKQ